MNFLTTRRVYLACVLVLAGALACFAAEAGGRTLPNGRPNSLHLDSAADREAFRGWFTAIAEYEAVRPAEQVPAEITDCAALLRFAYRGALQRHNAVWLAQNGLEGLAPLPSVAKYAYPRTPVGAALFRVAPPGPWEMTSRHSLNLLTLRRYGASIPFWYRVMCGWLALVICFSTASLRSTLLITP